MKVSVFNEQVPEQNPQKAEGILRDKARQAGLDWQIDSAGTNGYQVARLNVPDPCCGSEPGYHEVHDLISGAADRIIAKYKA